MRLPFEPPLQPQLAKAAKELPLGQEWLYEPKWDGFRVIAFVDGSEQYLQSRGSRPLSRYFPELVLPPGRYIVDGEIVILDDAGRPNFEALQTRLHPAESRVQRLAAECPATLIAFDVLADGDASLLEVPFAERRVRLEPLLGDLVAATPASLDPEVAAGWLDTTEGVIAKDLAAPYRPGKRAGMVKVKRVRTIDCVVVGYRPGVEQGTVGSLILGLNDAAGRLQVMGHSSGFSAKLKRELVDRLTPYETGARGSGDASRWSGDRELGWVSLRPELVVEVSFDHASGGRIRHGARLHRFRGDRDPETCLLADFE